MAHITITVSASRYADADDCLAAAVDAYVAAHPETEGYDFSPRWGDDERETIELDVPAAD